jgi:hypothetical protein
MSIPGEAKSKYTHEVMLGRSRGYLHGYGGFLYRFGVFLFVLFVIGNLSSIMDNVKNMRLRQEYMLRDLHREIMSLK